MRKIAVVILVILSLPILLVLSAQLSLDRSYAHSQATEKLPLLSESSEGLVRIQVEELTFRARVAGLSNEGPAIILLHGFPETSVMWEPLIQRAAANGYRVIAYDQRGFSPGARPERVERYRVVRYVEDLTKVADVAGFEEFHLVGHDWGALVGWKAAIDYPQRIKSWTALSIPHPAALMMNTPEERPTYIKVFQIPNVAETLLGFAEFWPMRMIMYATMSEAEKAEYQAVFSEPGALTAALNIYRGIPEVRDPSFDQPATQPVLYIYGTEDIPGYVKPEVQARLPPLVEGPLQSVSIEGGHWLIQDHPDFVVDHVLAHLEKFAE